ncbi:type ISP restriction/modification enzyme [Kribbella sp. NPDC004536]|uniref:type ISP restriction/modification enzyme n=1 Tax=Kribbella sp. NPDC004536 TaxID=3364106 RepID=UPI0036C37889
MTRAIAESLGLTVTMIGETRLPDLSIRPDYAVDVAGARVGYVELKRPGFGIPETWQRPAKHDLEQWQRFQQLPNVIYSDGEQFARYSFGKLQGRVARLEPGLVHASGRLQTVGTEFARVMTTFLLWEPERPRNLDELVRLVANLCRLLRDDIATELGRERRGQAAPNFTRLATDWRQVLFPNLTDDEFADQYAQTVTFALLLARVEEVSFDHQSIGEIARLLGKKHSLMGRALTVLTDQPEDEHSVALATMIRVLSVVDWSSFPDDSYELLYENFLAKYDPQLRKKSGVYYTPATLVSFMTRFVDDILRDRLDRSLGFAERDVIVVDPAMGTGSFLADVINKVAETVSHEEGPGSVVPHLRELSNRLIGFENQAAPYAVAELRIHTLLKKRHRAEVPAKERRFLSDTLDDPDLQLLPLGRMYEAIEQSRHGANRVKRDEPVMVVIGNPPYKDKAKGTSSWIEEPSETAASPSLSAFRKPGNGKLEYVLSNKYVYFWRWATWKAFDAHPADPAGVVAMVCSAGFTTGRGFAGMREYLRRTTDEGWLIDLTPEGHQPHMRTRFFTANQQPICVAVFIRRGRPDANTPARIRRIEVTGSVDEKAAKLRAIGIDGNGWVECAAGWTDPLQAVADTQWSSMPALDDLMPWTSPGVTPNRSWVYAPDRDSLERRWHDLIVAPPEDKPLLLKETVTTAVHSEVSQLPGVRPHTRPLATESDPVPTLQRVAHRSFDRKWLIADARVLDRPRTPLWLTYSDQQIFVVEQHDRPITAGPGLMFPGLIPDVHHFMGRGGRVAPLYRDAAAMTPNVVSGLLELLEAKFDFAVGAQDLVAYIAAVTAHGGFARRFAPFLATPGIRIPLTADAGAWVDALELGREVLWLHSYGERSTSRAAGRPPGPPRMSVGRPKVRVGIPDTEEGMPTRLDYDAATCTLFVGAGEIAPVPPEVFEYQVSGMLVLKHWFDYRRSTPSGKRTSPLNDIVATRWTARTTTELLELLNVLGRCVALEPAQDELLTRILDGDLIGISELEAAQLLPPPTSARRPLVPSADGDLFSE